MRKYLDNLVALKFAPNPCYPQVIPAEKALCEYSEYLSVNENRTWSWRNTDFKIGYPRPIHYDKEGVIGIYDKTKVSDLDAMVHHWEEIVSSSSRSSIDMD